VKLLQAVNSIYKERIEDLARQIEKEHSVEIFPVSTQSSFTGIELKLNDEDQRMFWYRSKNDEIHRQLVQELLPYLAGMENPNSKANTILLLDLFFFVMSTGMSCVQLARFVKVDGKHVSDRTLSSWLKRIFKLLVPWAEKQWHLLSDEEWINDSKKNEHYSSYKDKMLYFVDGSIIPINDSTSHPCSRAIRNGKHKTPAYVFFVFGLHQRKDCICFAGAKRRFSS
jgi:hypothetical protein